MWPLKFKEIQWGWVLLGGWLMILLSAAIFLPHKFSDAVAYPILALMAVWFLLSVVTVSLYLHRAWKRVGVASNKAAYIGWLSIETAFAVAVVVGIVWFFVTPS